MAKLVSKAVDRSDGGWDFGCPDCEFTSTGWGTRKAAEERGQQHADEHSTGVPMPELADFNADPGDR